MQIEIRQATNTDHDKVWEIFHEVVARGDAYAFDPKILRDEALAIWFAPKNHCYVAERGGEIVGSYFLKANAPALGAHVANAGFMVLSAARSAGIGRIMAEHCLSEARRLGFRSMQFNFVISTNEAALRLWKQLGFKIVGTLPGAFRHPERGYVDVYVMFRSLLETGR